MLSELKILLKHGRQYIADIKNAQLPDTFRGRPVIEKGISEKQANDLINLCPTQAIERSPFRIDLGKCSFCNECAFVCPDKIKFTNDYKIATNERSRLIVKEAEDRPVTLAPELVRKEIYRYFKGSLKLRQVSAGGDNSCEMELNACGNVNFDLGRFGIEFVASPRHADGIVITGPVTASMAEPLQICYEAVPDPKIIILAGTDAISGGLFTESPAIKRNSLNKYTIDLYVPGHPVHPLTFINGILELLGQLNRNG